MSELDEPYDPNRDEEPEIWDEHQWEEFLRESDRRTSLYIQLAEKYKDHPDKEKLIAIEMGWFHMLDDFENEHDFMEEIIPDEEGEKWKQDTGYDSTDFDSFENFPLYKSAFEYSINAMNLVNEQLQDFDDESVNAFARSITIPAAKIAGGFGFGFSLDSLGGNIANCKRGLTAANQMLIALQEMRKKDIIDYETFIDYYSRGKEVRDDLAIYIVELRERFRRGIP